MTPGTRWRPTLIVVAALIAYANSLSGPFIFDDVPAIVENPHIRSLAPSTALAAEREAPVAGRPIVSLSFAINYALDGLRVRGYHAVNIGIHLLAALLLFGLIRRTLALPSITAGHAEIGARADDLAFASAIIWTLHPLNTEVVDYMTQRTEALMAWHTVAIAACAMGMASTVMVSRYLQLASWPGPLVLNYGVPQPLTVKDVLPYAALLIVLLAGTGIALRRWPLVGFPGACVWIVLAPTSTFVPIATEVGAERRMYLPLAALITLAVVPMLAKTSRRTGAFLLAAVTLMCGARTILRNREYGTPLIMAQTVVDRWPTSVPHGMVGTELAAAGRHDEAIDHLRVAAHDYSRASFHLGGELFNRGSFGEAIHHLQRFLEQEPYLVEAVRARTLLGQALFAERRHDEAMVQFRAVLSMSRPGSHEYVTALGCSLMHCSIGDDSTRQL